MFTNTSTPKNKTGGRGGGGPLAQDPPLFNGFGIWKTQKFFEMLKNIMILLEEYVLLNRIVLLSISGKSP